MSAPDPLAIAVDRLRRLEARVAMVEDRGELAAARSRWNPAEMTTAQRERLLLACLLASLALSATLAEVLRKGPRCRSS